MLLQFLHNPRIHLIPAVPINSKFDKLIINREGNEEEERNDKITLGCSNSIFSTAITCAAAAQARKENLPGKGWNCILE